MGGEAIDGTDNSKKQSRARGVSLSSTNSTVERRNPSSCHSSQTLHHWWPVWTGKQRSLRLDAEV